MNPAVEFLGEYAVTTLIVASILMLLATAIVWRLIDRFWEPVWTLVARLWDALTRSGLGERILRIPLVRGSFTRTLTVWRYLGIHAVLSFAIALFALSGFAELADEIDTEEELA